MNHKYNKTHVITIESQSISFVVGPHTADTKEKAGTKTFTDQDAAIRYADKYLKMTPKDCKRSVDIFTVTHVVRKTVNRLSKKKGVWVADKAR